MSIAEKRVEFKSLEEKGNCQVKVGKNLDIIFANFYLTVTKAYIPIDNC